MEKNIRPIVLILVVVAIVVGIFLLEGQRPDRGAGGISEINLDLTGNRRTEKAEIYEPAKEITTPDGFINTDSFSIAEQVGKNVVLVDFWTYSCINCQRTLPYLNAWHERYADQGLTIIGIHTPEFEFEEEYENVKRAVEKFGIKYPVVLDNDYSTWRAYENRYWPRKYIIDIDGFVVYDHIGEGAYEETEAKIVELLNERSRVLGSRVVEGSLGSVEGVDGVDFSRIGTPETYLGYARLGNIANLSSADCLDQTCSYNLPQEIFLNSFALGGGWRIEEEKSVLVEGQGSIAIRFSASKVNLVAGAEAGAVRANIYLDGNFESTVVFEEHDLYNLVDLAGDYGEHELRVEFLAPGVSAFAFTFG